MRSGHGSRLAGGIIAAAVVSVVMAGSYGAAAEQVLREERGNLVLENVPAIPERISERLRQYQEVRSAALADWDPNGGLLIATRFGETAQLHHVAGPGMARRQVTFFPEPVGDAAYCPDGSKRAFLFTRDIGGNEFDQVFAFDERTGQSVMLTDGKSRHGSVVWDRRGERFAYFSTARNGRDWDIVTDDLDPATEPVTVLVGEGTWSPVSFSPDGGKMLAARYVSANQSHLFVVDAASGERREIDPAGEGEMVARGAAAWGPGGSVYFTSDRDSGFLRLRRYDGATGRVETVTEGIEWDVKEVEASEDGSRIAFTVNAGGVSGLYLLETATGRYERVEEVGAGIIVGLSFDRTGERLGMTMVRATSPADVYVLHSAGSAGGAGGSGARNLERWTFSEVGGLDTSRFIEPTLIEYETFDEAATGERRKVPAFYYRPRGDGPHPVMVYIHGGPESQFQPYFSSLFQYLVSEMGVAVVAPNVRGSAGYGKSYLLLDNGYKREDSVRDIGALLDWIERRAELNGERVCVYGGSYGGYMVLASLMHYGERLRCGVDAVGISNFVTFLTNTQDYRRDLRRVEYGDERDAEMRAFLERISPANHAERITRPLTVVQGLNDPRVPASESEQMVSRMRAAGGEVWYILAKDEGHGFARKTNRDFQMEAMILFLERHLLGGADGGAQSE